MVQEASREEISLLLRIARVDSSKALLMFNKCSDEFFYQPNVISKVIHFVKEDALREAKMIIYNLKDDWTKRIALSDLAIHAQSYDLKTALKIANLCDSYYKPQALKGIVSEVLKRDTVTAHRIAQSIDNIASQIGAFASIASHVHDERLIDYLIETPRRHQICSYNNDVCETFTNIASSIAGNYPHKAIELLKEIHCNKIDAIELVALNLSDRNLAIDLIKTSLDDDSAPWLSMALGAMALKIAETDMQKALTLIDEIQNEYEKENALFWLHEEWER